MIKGELKVYLAQIDIAWEDKAVNQKIILAETKKAVRLGADVVVFPEMTLTGFAVSSTSAAENEATSESLAFFKKNAKQNKIAVVCGVLVKSGKKKSNLAFIINSKGAVLTRYQKMHNFTFGGEDNHFVPGQKITTATINGFKLAPVICYDLRFPGLFEALSKKRPDVFLVIANWPAARSVHWQQLLPARALDTQSFVVGVNRVGEGSGLHYSGNSAAYNPWGEKIVDCNSGGGKMVTLKKNELTEIRNKFSSLKDKRYKIYSSL